MEKFALNLLSDGILFLHLKEDEVFVDFSNSTILQLLGTKADDWLSAFVAPDYFLSDVRKSIKEFKTFERIHCIRNQKLYKCKFSPYNEESIVVSIHVTNEEIKIENFVQVLSKFQEVEAAVIEYHPELQDWKYIFVSPTIAERAGRKISDYIGKFSSESNDSSPEIRKFVAEKLSKVSQKNEAVEVDFKSYFPQNVVLRATFVLLEFNEDGFPVFLSCTTDGIAFRNAEKSLEDKKRALVEANETYSIMKSYFDLAQFPMGTAEVCNNWTDFKLVIMNGALKKDMDVQHKNGVDIRVKTAREFVPPEYVDLWLDYFAKCKETKQPIMFEYFSPFTGRSYSNNVIQVTSTQFSWISVDITHINNMENELKKLKDNLEALVHERTKELQEALQMKGRFLATMSHELRTPISGISGSLQLISETTLTNEQFENVNVANVCTQQLLIVVNDILDLSKLEENKMNLEEIPCSLFETVEEAVQVVASEAEKKSLDIVCDIPTSLPTEFIGDQVRLRQILVNLLSNAVKFSHEGTISVQVRISSVPIYDGKHEITFSVTDEGIGITETAKENLFQPFTQADSSTTRKYGGSGLGLSICKKLCEMMGGKIWVESQPNKGSTFFFTIVSKIIHSTFSSQELDGKNIIVISNNTILVKTLKSCLPQLYSAFSLSEGIEVIKKIPMNFILLDCNIKEIEPQLTSKLSLESNIIVFGFSHQIARWEGKSNVFVLKKPLRIKSLFGALQKMPTKSVITPELRRIVPSYARILVAEDNKLNQHIIGKMLITLGFENVKFVDNGKLAVIEATEREYDIVLMDIMMPEMGGMEATRTLRNIKDIKQPIIIALTADVLAENEMYSSNGFDDVMYKPINKPKLGALLRRYTS